MSIENTLYDLEKYCLKEKFKGWDPYDGLNSKIFQLTPFKFFYLTRLVWIQFFKRSPINFRRVFLVPKDYNPKAIALFLNGYCNLYSIKKDKQYLTNINLLADKLIKLRTENYDHSCWGYNFDWQSRAFFLPKFTPTVVVTSFAADALIHAYEITKNEKYLNIALDSANFIVKSLNRTNKKNGFIFSYSPKDSTCVYNASLLGTRLLSQAYFYTKNESYKKLAFQSVNSVIESQNSDGSWVYGELEIQNWIDSFHTGYNLECIFEYQKYTGDYSFEKNLEIGLKYYIENFFLNDGTPKYYNNQTNPIDIHSPAQFIATLCRMNVFAKNRELAELVMQWTINNMKDDKGYFYYQIGEKFLSKIPYMRWAQAWMFYSFTFYLKGLKNAI